MKRSIGIYVVIGVAALACSAGCAKHELVKQDQLVPPATPPAASQPAKPAAPAVKQETKESAVATPAVTETRPVAAEQAPAAQQDAAALQSALQKIFFDFDSSNLSPQAREALAKNAELLKKNAGNSIRIEGNCDERGSDDYNLALGERRAKAAQEYLQHLGVASQRLNTISYGKEKPADAGHDEAAMAKNRRDDFVVISK